MAFGHHFSGRISALIGTHTHIPTADAHIMQGGTAYQTDAGMTGPFNSVIGVEKEIAIHKFVKKLPGEKFRPAKGEATLCGVIIQTQPNGLAKSISPIKMGGILGD
jgi:calcineurin-like phosphoesterase